MIKRFFAIILVLFIAINSRAGIGDWEIYTSFHDATSCRVAGDKIYVLASNSLFVYDKDDNSITTYDKLNSLSDFNIAYIDYCKEIDALVIVYKNANIDILYSNDYVYNISDFKNKILSNKNINGIDISGKTAYLNTDFGVVVLNLSDLEFTNTYNLGVKAYSTCTLNNNIYIGTENGILKGSLNDNLLDKSNWTKINSNKTLAINKKDNKLVCVIDKKGACIVNENGTIESTPISTTQAYKYSYEENNTLYIGWEKTFAVVNSTTNYKTYTISSESKCLYADGNKFWNCKGYKGVVESKITDNNFTDGENYIIPNSPVRNLCEYMTFIGDSKLLVAGGTLNYFDNIFQPGTLMELDYASKEWTNFPEDEIKTATGAKYVNMCSIDEDPTEPGHYFASSFGQGLYEFRNGKFVAHYNHKNSPIESPVPSSLNYVRIPRVKFDASGNLWVVNTNAEKVVKILKKDGTWVSLNYSDIANFPTMVDLIIDARGWLWVTSYQGVPGIFCAKMNNTPFDTADDRTKLVINTFTNQDDTDYTIDQVYCITEDKNGEIWVGTNNGLFVIDDADKFFNDGTFTQIKVSRNDGSGLADYLFASAPISALQVDGANRKWVGTKNNGIYLVSADGQETLHHFTKDNSVLPSNEITSIAIHKTRGEVFIGTSEGIVSYMSDATEPELTLQESAVHAYPNPVKSSYNGVISIIGLTHGCEIKIVDMAGYLITEGTSVGGQFTWNGRNASGEKVSSGIYYVLMYDANGDESLATKILITR